ncbi:serine hydrolase [Nesterenkonia sp. HG001]|uniref:serine hydrolase n=1 Tax=Nesterenkonia sp. HG001 TaxID=2983207 RepID=UPI002AC3FFAB|nr:serine hydrolase [Nesterenkonia sp. HG001]MDZ5076098.1 class A beta-lactamase-related serine hydrolase [Nesterenkonia sp. HG001]
MTPLRPLAALDRRIRDLTADAPFAVHWQISDITSTELPAIGSAADTQVASFSTRKVSLLLACLALVHQGRLALDARLPITDELKDGVQAGIMKDLAPGVELTLEDHLRQMMITSDNICTQLVFDAIGGATQASPAQPASLHQDDRAAAALQQVNDYCAWVGMRNTLHREIFPRSGELTWHHSIEQMTVTTAADQAHLLAQLGRGTQNTEAAEALHLTPQLCRFAVELMHGLHTPLLVAQTIRLRVAEKNGRGLRSLSQIGLATTDDGAPVAAVAVYAETIPTELPDGTPGRIAACELFGQIGQAIEDWHDGVGRGEGRHVPADARDTHPVHVPSLLRIPADIPGTDAQLEAAAAHPGVLAAIGGVTGGGHEGGAVGRDVLGHREFHPLAGTGKLLAALALAEREAADPGLLEMPVRITAAHRRAAVVGPLRIPSGSRGHTGERVSNLTLSLHDALGLIIGTSDAATALAVRNALEARGVDLVAEVRSFLDRFDVPDQRMFHTQITGLEDPETVRGDLLTGETSAHELRQVLMLLTSDGGLLGEDVPDRGKLGLNAAAARRVLGWMSQVFEPSGLAWALPGYGPKKVPQWTVSGLESRAAQHGGALSEGWTSVLITRRPGVVPTDGGVLWMAAHVPARTGREASRILGELGLTLHRRGLSRPKLRGNVAPMYIQE